MTKRSAVQADHQRRIEYLPISEVVGATRNPKNHDVAGIVVSISKHGFIDPVLLDGRTNRLVGGHGRIESLRRMEQAGEEPPEGVLVKDGIWHVPVVMGWASRSDTEAEQVLVGLNQWTITGGWDKEGLASLLSDLDQAADGLVSTGYDKRGLDDLLRVIASSAETPTDPWQEWKNMPAADNVDLTPVASVHIHFLTDEDADAFFSFIGRERSAQMWWPESDGHVQTDSKKAWVSADVLEQMSTEA